MEKGAVELRVLGPVEVVGDDGPISLAAMPRRLLAVLVSRVGETCSSDVLVDALWGESPPASATKLLHVYVSQLRKALPAPAPIVTRTAGYVLQLSAQELDARRFERLVEEGRAAMRERNPALAASLLDRALGLWRGPAYGEFAYEELARADGERLEELRLVAIEERLEARLALGGDAELLPELRKLCAEQPRRERLQAQTMLALYRCGRQTDALELFAAFSARLGEELGLAPGSELRALQRRILQHDPRLAVVAAVPAVTDLPAAPNVLLGRKRELAELHDLLLRENVRLVVLSGAGGSGKSRLALEAARETALSFANGAAFVELAPLRDPTFVVGAISRALAIDEVPGQEPLETLATALHPSQLLLVLDNAEHLRAATSTFTHLLARAPHLTLLVTSRAVLHLSGEHVYPVQPLAEDAAVALFDQRAREADARFAPETADEQAVQRICARLDGLPLAIELAAARTRTLSPRTLLEHLNPRLPLLTGGPRDLPARQQTLRATLEWSFNLLDPGDKRLATRLAVFLGSFDLEAAIEVCDADLDGLTSLLEQSLLERTTEGRFSYLETIREYALERLHESPDADEIHRRHLRFFLQVAQSADLSAVRRRGGEKFDIASAAQHNLRAALAWSVATGSVSLGLELASTMERFWVTHDPREGMRWFEALLSRPEAEAVAPALRADALRAYGSATDIAGEDEAARRLYEQSLALFEQIGDTHGQAVLLHRLGISAMRRGYLRRARALVETSHAIHERADNRWGQAQTFGALGAIARDAGDEQGAFELIHKSAALAHEAGVGWWESGMLAELANLSLNAGRIDEGEQQARQSLVLAHEIGDRAGHVFGVGLFARIAAARGQQERALSLWTAVAHDDAVAPLGGWRRHRETFNAHIRTSVGSEFDRRRDQNPALTLDEAVTLAFTAD